MYKYVCCSAYCNFYCNQFFIHEKNEQNSAFLIKAMSCTSCELHVYCSSTWTLCSMLHFVYIHLHGKNIQFPHTYNIRRNWFNCNKSDKAINSWMVNALTFYVEAASENEKAGYKNNLHTCIRGWSKFERKKFIERFHFLSPWNLFFVVAELLDKNIKFQLSVLETLARKKINEWLNVGASWNCPQKTI